MGDNPVVDCPSDGMGKGGGIAQKDTTPSAGLGVIVVGMSPGRRHVTKPYTIHLRPKTTGR